jgi:hypothetical protein
MRSPAFSKEPLISEDHCHCLEVAVVVADSHGLDGIEVDTLGLGDFVEDGLDEVVMVGTHGLDKAEVDTLGLSDFAADGLDEVVGQSLHCTGRYSGEHYLLAVDEYSFDEAVDCSQSYAGCCSGD